MSDKVLDNSNIEQLLKAHIAEEFMYDRPASDLDNDLHLIQEGIIDSLGIFMLISFIDDQFDVKIQPDDVVLDNFQSIESIKQLILSRK
ncbi:MAG: acyl carrier protein [Anaerolineales bacterium]|nr:acyl carrier protein [Anaerolineales bacterium]